ncbi:MAG: glycoside hydrolase family 31 protein [bacterium]
MPYHKSYDPVYASIPFVLVLREGRAHGLFFDNPCRCRFDVGKASAGTFNYTAEGGELDLYVMEGPSVKEVVERFTALTGRHPMPARWSLGFQQSRWSYMNDSEVREIASELRSRDIPCDAIHMDIHYMDRYRVFTFDKERFPDPPALSQELSAKGIKLVSLIDPGIAKAEDCDLYVEGRSRGYFCKDKKGMEFNSRVWPGKVAFPDFSKPEVREWWADLQKRLLDAGIRGVWNDMNEPSCWSVDVRTKNYMLPLHPVRKPKMIHDDGGRNTPHLCFRNVYGQLLCSACREGLKKHRPGERPFVITRAGYAGIQRHAVMWTGDNSSAFSHLALSIPMLLNLGLSGVSFCGPDIGGFMWNCSAELFARWIELGAFYPFCRNHTAVRTRRQEPWRFGTEVENISRQYLKLRYKLHPTMYTLAHESHETGAPVLRPLFYEFQDDHGSVEIEDQCLFGPFMMLAPVVKKKSRQRNIYLPPGGWYDFWTGERFSGPTVITREAPLDLLPIYVREGGIIFQWPAMDHLDQASPARIIIDFYPAPGISTEWSLYDDDGISDEHEQGKFMKRSFKIECDGTETRLLIGASEGGYRPGNSELVVRVRRDKKPGRVMLDDKEIPEEEGNSSGSGYAYSIADRFLRMTLAEDHAAHEIKITE